MRLVRLLMAVLWLAAAASCATLDDPLSGAASRRGLIQSNEILKVGDVAPGIQAVDGDGKRVSPSFFQGKPLLLDFGSVYCMNCRDTIVYLEDVRRRFGPLGLTVVMVAVDGIRAAEPARQYWAQVGADFPLMFDDGGRTAELYGVDMIPYQFLLDREGFIQAMHTGYDGKMIPDKMIRKVLSDQGDAGEAVRR